MRRSRKSGKADGRPSAALSGRGARRGPQPGRRRDGAGGPRACAGSGEGASRRPRPPSPGRQPAARPAQAPPTTPITCAPRTLPWRGPGARGRAVRPAGSRGRKLRGRARGLGTRPKSRRRAGTRPGPAAAARGGKAGGSGAGPVVKGGACCWVWRRKRGEGAGPTGCLFGLLVYSWRGSFNPKGGRERGKTRSRIFERLE